MRINSLLAGMVSRIPAGEGVLPPMGNGAPSERTPETRGDTFTQGQWWKNLAGSRAAGGASCGCGACAACAARAYGGQAGGQPGLATAVNVPGQGLPDGGQGAASSGKGSPAADDSANSGQEVAQNPGGQSAVPGKGQPANASAAAGEDGARGPQQAVTGPKGSDGEPLSQGELLQVAELRQIDTEVKAHEMAHVAAAGSYARSGANFQYATGPDGRQYAVAGEVGIDTSEERTPQATISKMQTVRAAALAPADPSPQDRNVAAKASMVITKAGQELSMVQLEQARKATGNGGQGAGREAGAGEDGAPASAAVSDTSGSRQPSGDSGSTTPAPRVSVEQRAVAATMQGLTRPLPTLHFTI